MERVVTIENAAPEAVGTPAGQEIAPSENAPLALVGTFVGAAGHEIAPSANAPPEIAPSAKAPPEIAPSANAPPEFVGTPPGQEIAPSEKAPSVLLPAGVPALVAEVV